MTRTALTTAVFVMLAVVCLPLRADDASFTRELKAGVEELKKEGEELAEDDPNSSMAKDLSDLFTDVGQQLLQENARLRQEETPVAERVAILRRLYLQQMRKIHEMKTDGASAAFYNEWMQFLRFYRHNDSSGRYFDESMLSFKLQESLNIGLNYMRDLDPYLENLLDALMNLDYSWSRFYSKNRGLIGNLYRADPMSPASDTASRAALKMEFPAGAESMVDTVVHELTKLGIQLEEQNVTDEERSKKLRERFLEIVQRVDKIWQIVQYNEPTGHILFFDRAGNPRVDSAGNQIAFYYPPSLMRILGLKTEPQLRFGQLEEAVDPLIEKRPELIFRHSGSVMAQNLASLFEEIGSQLLLRNEQLKKKKTPEEERIPILRQLYLQQMRRIHEMEPDDNSIALYNERRQFLYFYHYRPNGGGGGINGLFLSKLELLLKIQESIDKDPAARELTEALRELSENWWTFYDTHSDKISHIVEREIVSARSNPRGLSPPQPTPLEERWKRNLDNLMEQTEYELTKLDVELAEQKTPQEERAKKLRDDFFERIRTVKYIGLEVQVEGAAVKIPFRDASGPIVDSAGAPIVFEFPPKLMAALNMQAPTQGNAKRLQLLMGGGAALLLLVLAGVFLVMKRNSAKKADRYAETQ